MNNFPNWLKSEQNGTIGEIRTKAFLMNRFWIMERSVDIHGADFIIQRRLYSRNLLDEQPIRFGVVQVKFSQDEKTIHKIKKNYVLDNDNNPRIDFFLIIHTGNEEDEKMFLITSKEISKNFSMDKNDEFIIPSKEILSSSKYQIIDKKLYLDRIENSIQCAEFYKNRLFVFHKEPSINSDFDTILPEYKENIEHSFGAIPEIFKEQKKKVFDVMQKIQEAYKLFEKFLESVDPVETCYIADEIYYQFSGAISLPMLTDTETDFYYGVKRHKEMVENMRNDGALDNYISNKKSIINNINEFLQDLSVNDIFKNTTHEITVEYDPIDLRFKCLSNSLSNIPENILYSEFYKFLEAKEGHIVMSWKVGHQFKVDGYISMNACCLFYLTEKIYTLKYEEDHDNQI